MNKFKITWYRGNILEIKGEFSSIIVEAASIDNVDYMKILPESIRKQSYYQRVILTDENTRNIDYGSYIDFIEVKIFNKN